MRRPLFLIATLALIASGSFASMATVRGSSHRDAPSLREMPDVDGTDFYMFVSPENPLNVVFVTNYLGGPTVPGGAAPVFDPNVLYAIHIDVNGDFMPDATIDFQRARGSAQGAPASGAGIARLRGFEEVPSFNPPDDGGDGLSGDANGRFPHLFDIVPPGFEKEFELILREAQGTTTGQGGGSSLQLFVPITPPGAAPVIAKAGQVKVFAAPRDDPFFGDYSAVRSFVDRATNQSDDGFFVDIGRIFDLANLLRPPSAGQPRDTFAGMNVHSLVIEIPIQAITREASPDKGKIGVWATASRRSAITVVPPPSGDAFGPYIQVSRMGMPLINEVIIPLALKDAFNASHPKDDEANFLLQAAAQIAEHQDLVELLRGGPSESTRTAQQIARMRLPDVLTIDLSRPDGFPNGRRLNDDVIDLALEFFLNTRGITDGIDANDKPFLPFFTYLAEPHVPAPGGPLPPDEFNFDNIILKNKRTLWDLSLGFFALAMTFGGAGIVTTKRGRDR